MGKKPLSFRASWTSMSTLKQFLLICIGVTGAWLLLSWRYLLLNQQLRMNDAIFNQRVAFRGSNHKTLRNGNSTRGGRSWREYFHDRAQWRTFDQQRVVEMTQHAWKGYRQFGEWSDYLNVIHMERGTVYAHDMSLTLVDSLDTLFIMGLHEEFDEASAWAKDNLHNRMFQEGSVSFFEITIRSLGGLLSAYYLSGEKHLLELAKSLGDALNEGFTCGEAFVPCRKFDLVSKTGRGSPFLSEANTFQLEFAYLAHATKTKTYLDSVKHINTMMIEMVEEYHPDGLIPVILDWDNLRGFPSKISMGALGDSYFEYLLKQWLQSNKQDHVMKKMYMTAVDGMKRKLIGRSFPSNFTFVGEMSMTGQLIPVMEHLTCFVPGMLALGYAHGMPVDHLKLAKELTASCMQMYLFTKTKLAPEMVRFNTDKWLGQFNTSLSDEVSVPNDQDYNILRPETVESLMILYRVTGDELYREYGRVVITALETHSKVEQGGYRSTNNVYAGPVKTRGMPMESFFIAETLKYLYLLFSDDDLLPLDEIVFNTEAHPLPIIKDGSITYHW